MDIKEFRRQILLAALQNPACIETNNGRIVTEDAIRVVTDISRRIDSAEGGWEFFGIEFDDEDNNK